MHVPWRWVVLLGAFLSRVITTGVVCMSVFYNDLEHVFSNWSNAQLAAIFSTATGLLEGSGIIASLLMKKFESRYLIMMGGVLAAIGVAIASGARNYVQMIICLGILNGLGQGFARCLMPVAVAHSFDDRRRHVALSIANVGDGVGGLIFPILYKHMIDGWGWRGALLITAGIVAQLLISGAVVDKHLRGPSGLSVVTDQDQTKPTRRSPNRFIQKCLSLSPNVEMCYANVLAHSIGYYIFMTFIYNDLTETQGIDPSLASAMFSCVGGVSIVGRLSVSAMNNRRVPRWLIYSIMHIIRGLIVLCFNAVPYLEWMEHRIVAYFLLCSSFGLTDGITGALIPVISLDLFGLRNLADIYGLQLFFLGIGALIGAPVAGALKDAFSSAQLPLMFSSVSFIIAGVVLLPLFCTKKHYQQADREKRDIELVELANQS